ncbi:MAG: hypothetical protein SGARI_003258, partial [Bacillariaceae sp.]
MTDESSRLYQILFFGDLSFLGVALVSLGLSIVGVITYAFVTSSASLQAARTGRELRRKILDRAIHSSGGTEGNEVERLANQMIVNVRVIEDFRSYDEHSILKTKVVIVVAGLLSMIAAWFGGLVAIVIFLFSELLVRCCEQRRQKYVEEMEKNAASVNARLLDVIKNGVKIKIADFFEYEQDKLTELELNSDEPRTRDAKIKFQREIYQNGLLSIIPAMMGIVGSQFTQQMASTGQHGIDIAYSILLLTLLLDEAYKAIWVLVIAEDKKVGAVAAQKDIAVFLGEKNRESLSSVQEEDTSIKTVESPESIDAIESAMETTVEKSDWKVEPGSNDDAVELHRALLRYPGRDQAVLNQYSQTFLRGKIHALVGESGSGKSTALKVIAQLLKPDSGSLKYWNGMKVAYVSQDQKLFARSIRENVSYGMKAGTISDEDLWKALRLANMDDFVRGLPNGLDHVL